MTDYTKLVEALRYCKVDYFSSCLGCPMYADYEGSGCINEMHGSAATAIEELQAKVDRLTKENRELAADRPEMEEVNGHWEWRKPNGEVLMPKRGEWIDDEFGAKCSYCGKYAYWSKYEIPFKSPYCPLCGAKMMEVQK